ncbi:Crp/Fnr family transcriptional regulator [Paracrocinitomix mangrovi]|uniref:Crp/Fnr family transcriptional regulator n=1 Tax=Paracrocinitomix mangrovi TaxID=2862509 RepID=UPI001C8CFD4E|nr:Crp/Fnr family transcriptional regulator [Paracrocinitomix mangrovi]UKN01840.1 Crp/Fnr family transcriptional regulator [Paracrocinitomix mangrovi]
MNQLQIIEDLIERHGTPRMIELDRGDLLCSAGKIDTNIYLIQSGCLIAYVTDEDEERIIRFGYQNNIFVLIDSFLSEKPTDLYVTAIKKSKALVFSKEHFMQLIGEQPTYQKIWNEILADLVVQQLEREIDLLTNSPQERYHRVLKRSPQLFQEVPNKYIANYLRMTAETFSRIQNS